MKIESFHGEYRWLSNFWPAVVTYEGRVYPSVENAYQAAKVHPSRRGQFRSCSAAQAKRLGRLEQVSATWDQEKVYVMKMLIRQKFSSGSELAEKLIATGDCEIVEGNTWGDVFWGVCNGSGENNLGKILMTRRATLIRLRGIEE